MFYDNSMLRLVYKHCRKFRLDQQDYLIDHSRSLYQFVFSMQHNLHESVEIKMAWNQTADF